MIEREGGHIRLFKPECKICKISGVKRFPSWYHHEMTPKMHGRVGPSVCTYEKLAGEVIIKINSKNRD
jgi:hypothetical protein